MSSEPATASPAELVGRFIDGPADPAVERELARRIAGDPALGRLLRHHLRIAELAHHQAAPERAGAAFAEGWAVRVAAEADAALFTARTMLRIAADPADRRTELAVACLRLGGLAAAACLLIGLGWGASALLDLGRQWLGSERVVHLDGSAYVERGAEMRRLQEAAR